METFYVEQADGTWHKMSLAEGVERNIKNAVFEGKYKTISNERMMEQMENRLKKDQFDFFMAKENTEFLPLSGVEKDSRLSI